MARIYAYLRCSHELQAHSGLGIEAQMVDVARDAQLLIGSPYHGAEWSKEHWPASSPPGYFIDLAVSAWKTDWISRPAVAAMLPHLERGDWILASRLDRIFRNVKDFSNTLAWLTERGINLRFASQQLDLGSANGRALTQILAVFAEWESSIKSERIRAALAARPASAARITRKKRVAVPARPLPPLPPVTQWPTLPAGVPILSPGLAYGYVRVSGVDSAEKGLSPEAQQRAVDNFYRYLRTRPEYADVGWGESLFDLAVSAYKFPLTAREGGAALNEKLRRGDHVIVSKLDRGFRSMRDFAMTFADWRARGISLHFADLNLSMNSPTGHAMAGLLSVFAEWESAVKSERNKAVIQRLKADNRVWNKGIPRMMRRVRGNDGLVRIAPDWAKLLVARYIRVLRDVHKLSWDKISDRIEAILATRQNRAPISRAGFTKSGKNWTYREWNHSDCRKLYLAHKESQPKT